MTLSTTGLTASYSGNGVTTAFSFPYRFLEDGDLVVTLIDASGVETLQTLTTDYTVTGAGGASGGTVTMTTAPASGETLFIRRTVALTQETDYISGDPFPAETHEEALDRLTMIAQQIDEGTARTVRLSDADSSGANTVLPTPAPLNLFRWNNTGTALEAITVADVGDLEVSPFIETLLDDTTASTALSTLGVTAFIKTLLDDESASAAQTTLGLPVFDTISDLVAATLSSGIRAHTREYAAGKRGAGSYLIMTATAATAAGVNVDERGEAFTTANGNIAVLQWQDRVLCTQFGIFPDGVTEWQNNGFNTTFLTFLRDNDVTGVFVAGFYKSKLDNYYSNVSIYCEPGAFWGGTVHAAINTNSADPNTGRAQNVVWKGQIGSYERVGSYNCDNVEIESILVKEDVAKNPSGLRGGGVHFYNSSKNMKIGSIIVEASERSYGLGIDTNNSNPPEDIHIGSVHIKKSYTHGAAFVCKNTRIDQLIIDDYAVGLLTDVNLTNTVPGSTVPLTDLHGFIVDGGEYPSFGEVIVRQSNAGADAGYGAWLNSASLKVDRLVVRDAVGVGIGVLNKSAAISNIDELDVRSCSGEAVLNEGNMTIGKYTGSQNGGRGFQQSGGNLNAKTIVVSSNNGEGFRAANAANLNIDSIVCSSNNVTTSDFQVFLNAVVGRIGFIQTARTATGLGGGISLNGDLDGLNILSVDLNNESKASTTIAGFLMTSVTGVNIGALNMEADNAATAWQPLRMVTVTDVSINSAIIENQFNGNGIVAATYTRLGFTNCNNKTGTTNVLLASGAASFNSVACAT